VGRRNVGDGGNGGPRAGVWLCVEGEGTNQFQ